MKKYAFSLLAVYCLAVSSGCQSPTDQSARIATLESRLAAAEGRLSVVENSLSAVPTVAAAPPSVDATATAAPTVSATASPDLAAVPGTTPAPDQRPLWQELSYDDLPNPERLREFTALGFLPKAGIASQADLEGPLTRGQYVAILVEANNALHPPEKQIRLAREGDGQSFDDVPASHPYYRYIEGMVKAGYVIGFDEKSFQPDKRLTREELVAIMAKRDYDFKKPLSDNHWDIYVKFTDRDNIAPKYRESVIRDMMRRQDSNLNEAFGELKLFHPKDEARAYEAVLSLHGLGNYSDYQFKKKVKDAMGR